MKLTVKILVVEDDPINRKIFSRYLSDYENVVIVESGEEAIKECEASVFDLVLMDIRLKNGMDGIKTRKSIKGIREYKYTPVLAVTAYAMTGDKEYFLREGFDDYLAKPFLKKDFFELINKYVTRIQMDKSNEDDF